MSGENALRGNGLEVLATAAMYAADEAAMRFGVSGRALMERAGAAVARIARAMLEKSGRRVLVLAGPGNNGGDGFVAARVLRAAGLSVEVALLGAREGLRGDAAWAAGEWTGETLPLEAVADERMLATYDLVIDALFGAGLTRSLAGVAAELAARVNALRTAGEVRVLAVDVPSGLDGDSGLPMNGGPCFEADATVTFFRRKPAHALFPGRDLCGRVHVADIGIPARVLRTIAPAAYVNTPALWAHLLPKLTRDTNKYRRGSLAVLSGDALHTGAARLAARAALRAGAGAVTLLGEREALLAQAAQVTEIMLEEVVRPADLSAALRRKHARALVIGPAAGVNARTRALTLAALAESGVALVLDADVFTAFRDEPEELFSAIRGHESPVVMTPHEGEFARLFPDLAKRESKLQRAREAARRAGCVVLLKGPDTVIADAEGTLIIDSDAPPWLATAGAGDVLAGAVGALLAQGASALVAAAAAARAHAAAGWQAGAALIAGDLIPLIGRELATYAGHEEDWRETNGTED